MYMYVILLITLFYIPFKSLMFEKMNTIFVSKDYCSWFFSVCVVIAAYHDHIIMSWWKLKHVGWELLAKAPMDPV